MRERKKVYERRKLLYILRIVSCLQVNIYGGTEDLNTQNFTTHLRWQGTFWRQCHFPTHTVFRPTLRFALRAFPTMSANPSISIQTRYTCPSSAIDND